MGERPILFSAPMVRAILEGRKTVTRRIVTARHLSGTGFPIPTFADTEAITKCIGEFCPYGQPGDRLWVRETWRPVIAHCHGMDACDCADVNVTYAADGEVRFFPDNAANADWTMPKAARTGNVSPLFLPRWASRITLEVTGVRVERLQAITEAGAIAEGAVFVDHGKNQWGEQRPGWHMDPAIAAKGWEHCLGSARHALGNLWNKLHEKDGHHWDASPWVWVVEFKRVTP